MEFGGREVNAAAVHVGAFIAQAIRLRADDAAVDDEGLPVVEVGRSLFNARPHPRGEGGRIGRLVDSGDALEFLQDGKLVAAEHGFRAVVAADFVSVLSVGGCIENHGDCAGGDERPPANTIRIVPRHDARAGRQDEMNRVAHSGASGGE